jgi:hypothetical protein
VLKDGTIQQQQQQHRSVLNPKANSFVDDLRLDHESKQDQLRNIQTMINKHSNDYDNEYGNKNNIGNDLLSSLISHIHTTDLDSDVYLSSSFDGCLPQDTSFSFFLASKSLGLRKLMSPSMALFDSKINGLTNHVIIDDHMSIREGHSNAPCLMTPSSNSSNSIREAKCSSGVKTSLIDVSIIRTLRASIEHLNLFQDTFLQRARLLFCLLLRGNTTCVLFIVES